ncbi:MAG: isoleucine--tRNA ligase [Gemmatales bacterium]|nr:isoleucine--tRNA ligase [Gemmatales bacterium]MDW7994661.1 isoleucine--tRNA ligase [Gemmatales bacterium]
MPFDKVETTLDLPALERQILRFWEESQAFERLREKNRGKPKWSFLDGPITANNPMGVHHAWGRTYKDLFQRFKAMTGHELRYQNGFDCQGLWVEVEVEKELGLRSKQDIENLVPGDKFASIDRFVQLCKQRVDRFARIQTQQSIRLGYWMDWDREEDWHKPPDQRRSYYTMSEENNYTIWHFLKRCHQRGLIYRAYDAMPWCPRCAVGISQMEMHEGYERVAHRAVFVKFPLRDRPGENLLVWTTTPWTLSSNVACAVHPELTYLKIRHQDELYYVAKGAFTYPRLEEEFRRKEWVEGVPKLKTVEQMFRERGGYEVVGEVRGREMLGWRYVGPFDELPASREAYGYPADIAEVAKQQNWSAAVSAQEAHRVIAWDAVGETEGTGIVHIAPGCGAEDFELGKREKLPPIAPLDEQGRFLQGFGPLTGMLAYEPALTERVLDWLRHRGLLVATELYPHNYPHCWRCKTELLFRLVDEWYIRMDWRDEIMRVCYEVTWIPEFGLQRELDWLRNMGDWMISKKRYWGLALPIWVCEQCGWFDVIGGRQELRERAIAGWEQFEGHSPHRPWIDLVKIRCERCGGIAARIPDVGNPWLDAGIVPFSTMRYNTEFHPDDPDRTYWRTWFPADFITECFPGQFRNWFYALLAMSTMLVQRAPFKTLLGHALVRDQDGEEMHKSKGNAIPFEGAADEGYSIVTKDGRTLTCPPMGADLIRWMFARHNPAVNINFGPRPAEEIRNQFFLKLWNTYAFFSNYARLDRFDPKLPPVPMQRRTEMDRWILSDLQLLIQTARRELNRYNAMTVCLEVEKFVDEKLSNWYVRRNRRRFWKSEASEDKLAAYQTLYEVLLTLCQLLAPIIPFTTEAMYQNLVVRGRGIDDGALPFSVHLCDYPEPNEALVDPELSQDMATVLRVVSLGLSARNAAKIKVRQPLAELKIQAAEEQVRRAVERFREPVVEELNVKQLTWVPVTEQLVTYRVEADAKQLGPKLGAQFPALLKALSQADAQQHETWAHHLRQGNSITVAIGEHAITLLPSELQIVPQAPEGWVTAEERGIMVLLDIRIDAALKLEGLARDVVRHVQNLRKQANLELEDRIVLYLHAQAPELQAALQAHRDYIGAETLTIRWANQPLGNNAASTEVKLDGYPLRIELQKA